MKVSEEEIKGEMGAAMDDDEGEEEVMEDADDEDTVAKSEP